jgi:hypothetical protein
MTIITSSMVNIGNKVKQVITTVTKHSSRSNSMLSHEHDFASATAAKGTDGALILCITCGTYYCDLCGKVLEDGVDNHHHCY